MTEPATHGVGGRQVIDRLPQTAPDDEFNRELVRQVHPPDWVNPKPAKRYNLVVIGAGTAGLVTAAAAAGLGAKVALVERDLMGGDCLNVGCVPSKGLLSAARVARTVRRASEFGVQVPGEVKIDFAAVMRRMRKLRSGISHHDSAERFRDLGVDVYLGDATFRDSNSVRVGDYTLPFKKAVIATGARASAPPIPGLAHVDYLTNETLFSLTELPGRLGVIGAGPVGCEMAQAFANFGSEVLLVEAMHGVLPREDRDAAQLVQQSLERDGVRVLCCGKNLELWREGTEIHLSVQSHDVSYEQPIDQLLVSVGRAPNVDDLGLESVGVEFETQTGVHVDDRLRTSNPNIFAAGDVCSVFKFTHAADFLARIVVQNALFPSRAKASRLVIPWCTYTSPEIAHVGLSESEALEKGIEIDTFEIQFDQVDRAKLDGQDEGLARVLVEKGKDQILGATIVAENAGDLISEVTLAMTHGLGLKKIASTIHPYPTQAEAIRKLGDQFNRTRLTPFTKTILNKWLTWQR
jgi:pyruvate/2-oxoglutarate dehydrogenase complex dihydrolipoamide dehydrogenase (E3) component